VPKVRIDDTLEMEYLVDDFTDPWKKPEVLVLQHGCIQTPELLYAWVPTLARHFRVIRPYLRGIGGSTKAPADYQWSLNGFTSDLKNFLDELGVDKVHYVGGSSGAIIGYGFAIQYPERLKTVTLVGHPAKANTHHLKPRKPWNFAEMVKNGQQEELIRSQAKVIMGENADPGMVEWHVKEGMRTHKETAVGFLSAWSVLDLTPELPKINVPTLLITADLHRNINSVGSTVEEMQHHQKLIPGSKLAIMPGEGLPQFMSAEKSAEAVLQFIREQQAAGNC